MHKAKKTRLEKKGWKVGTAQEFLGLSDEEAAYVEIRLRLAAALRERRQRERLSQTGLTSRIGSSQSRVVKMEGWGSICLTGSPDSDPSRSRCLESRPRPSDLPPLAC